MLERPRSSKARKPMNHPLAWHRWRPFMLWRCWELRFSFLQSPSCIKESFLLQPTDLWSSCYDLLIRQSLRQSMIVISLKWCCELFIFYSFHVWLDKVVWRNGGSAVDAAGPGRSALFLKLYSFFTLFISSWLIHCTGYSDKRLRTVDVMCFNSALVACSIFRFHQRFLVKIELPQPRPWISPR